MNFEFYHFHIYFDRGQLAQVEYITDQLNQFESLKIGRIRENPVGPHPTGSCQITVPGEQLAAMVNWFLLNRNGLDIFVHAVSGDDLRDHTEYVFWIGRSQTINLDFFKTVKVS